MFTQKFKKYSLKDIKAFPGKGCLEEKKYSCSNGWLPALYRGATVLE